MPLVRNMGKLTKSAPLLDRGEIQETGNSEQFLGVKIIPVNRLYPDGYFSQERSYHQLTIC